MGQSTRSLGFDIDNKHSPGGHNEMEFILLSCGCRPVAGLNLSLYIMIILSILTTFTNYNYWKQLLDFGREHWRSDSVYVNP